MSVVSEIKKGSKKIKAAQLDRITDISGRYFAEYNSSTGECKNPVSEPITNIVITGNSTKVNADPDIPNDYVAIEYIESDGNQYVKFGLHSSDDVMKYNLKVNLLEQYARRGIIGGDNVWFNGININKSKYLWADLRHPEVKITTEQPTGIVTLEATDNLLIVNGNNGISSPDTNSTFEDIWVRLPSNKDGIRKPIRVYKVEVENVGKWKVDCVPVIRKSDNKPGMYDKVSKQFFVNQGTGEFITGPELPGKILEVDTLTKHGKNLINIPDQEYTQNGVKITVKNGLITLNGTSTGRAWIILNSTINLNKGFYYFNKHKNNCLLRINESTVRYIEQSDKFIINEDNITIAAQILQEEHVTYTNKQYIMSVTKSSTEQIYEPYQQPEVISFDKDAGNMLNIPDQGPTTINGITYTIKNGVITLDGISTDAVILLLGDIIPTNSTNSFRVFNESKTFTTDSIRFYSFGLSGSDPYNWIDYLGNKDAWTNANYEVGLNRMFRLHIYAGQTFNNYIVKPMLVEGSVIPNKFYPYGTKIPDPVFGINDIKDKIIVSHAVGKNVLNVVNKEITYGGIKIKIENGMVNLISGTNSVRVNMGIAKLKDMPAGTYTLKQFYTPTKNIGIIGSIFTINDDGSEQFFDYFDNCINGINSKVYSIPKKWRADINVDIRNPNTTVDNEKLYPMLVYGSTEPTEFEPYMLNRVYRYNATGKEHLGDLNYSSFGNDLFGYNFKQKYKFVLSTCGNVPSICSKYKQNGIVSAGTIGEKEYALGSWYFNSGSCAFIFRDSEANNNVDAIKELLKGEYLIAPLNDPYYEDITDTPQGQKLLNLSPYQPYTTEFEVNNDGAIEFGYWRQIDPLPDTYTRVKALVSDGNQKITVNDIVGKNLFNPNGKREVIAYSSIKFIESDELCTVTLFDKGNNSDISGIYLSISDGPVYVDHANSFSPFISNGEIKAMKKNNQVGLNQRYLSVYPPNEDSWKKIFNRFNITIVKGPNGSTEFIPYISTMQNNSLEMSEPKKTLFQNKDNRVLSVDGYALKYNQLRMNSYSYTNAGITITANGGYETIVTGTSQSSSIWSKKITNDYYSKNGHLYGFIFPVQDLSAFRQVGCYLFANKGAGATIAGKYASSNSLIVLQATRDDCSLEIGIAVNQDVTINSKIIYQTIDLTDIFGAGNEPTTLDEFYATPQGKLYRGYVEYGYHILGAGEYKSNQLSENGKDITTGWEAYNSSNISVSYSDGAVIATSLKNEEGYGYPFGIQNKVGIKVVKGNKYLLVVDCKTEREDTTMYFDDIGNQHNWSVGKNWTKHEYIWTNTNLNDGNMAMLIKPRHALRLGETYQVREAYLVNLTELGLDHLTLDELKAQRPDLFVYKPYHETETRYGMILSDGRVHPLTGPLYGLNNVKDKGETNGVEGRKFGIIKLKDLVWNSWWDDETNPYRAYASIRLKKAGLSNMICSRYNVVDKMDGSIINGEMCGNKDYSYIYLKDTNYATFNDWKASLNDNDVIVYELATPTTTQSTSTSIDMDTSVTNEEYIESFTPVEQWIAKYYSGTHAVLNYIPAVRNSDLKPGMYEVATGEFKTNEGTGEFTYINDWTISEPVTLEVGEDKVEE